MLDKNIAAFAGVGPAMEEKLTKCGMHSISDLVFHLPARYQDRTHITPMSDLQINEWAVVVGEVLSVQSSARKRRMMVCTIDDQSGRIQLECCHLNRAQVDGFNQAERVVAFGEARQ